MASDYVLWTAKIEPNACSLSELEGFEEVYALQQGVRYAGRFPSNVKMQMDARKPTDMLLTDNLKNLHGVLVVSTALRDFVATRVPQHLEFLPLSVLDHKGRAVDREFHLMNPVDSPDCLDIQACQPEWSPIDKTVISHVGKLAIRTDWDAADWRIFRPKHYRFRPFIEKSLADEISAAGFSGVRWEPIGGVKGRLK